MTEPLYVFLCIPPQGDINPATAHPTREAAEAVAIRGDRVVGPYVLAIPNETGIRRTRPTSTGEPREDEL